MSVDSIANIANPIHDGALKYLLDDNKVARIFLSALIGAEILEHDFRPTEHNLKLSQVDFTVFRMDFAAKVRTEDGRHKMILLEIQKTKLASDVMRFRRYLGTQYASAENVVLPRSPPIQSRPSRFVAVPGVRQSGQADGVCLPFTFSAGRCCIPKNRWFGCGATSMDPVANDSMIAVSRWISRASVFYSRANEIYSTSSTFYSRANEIYSTSSTFYSRANEFYSTPSTFYSRANEIYSTSNTFYSRANEIHSTPSTFYSRANEFYSTPSTFYSRANEIHSTPSTFYSRANEIHSTPSTFCSRANEIHSTPSTFYSCANDKHSPLHWRDWRSTPFCS